MIVKTVIDEDFTNYKRPSMVIASPSCTFKCDKEYGAWVCQNSELALSPNIEIDDYQLIERYMGNKITSALVIAGLEPFDDRCQMISFLNKFRFRTKDDVVIYTGYKKEELEGNEYYEYLKHLENIVIKFGRFIPNQEKHYDNVLGVYLASDNQYAEIQKGLVE